MTANCLPLAENQLQAFRVAFKGACDDLKLGQSSLDASKQERLAYLILGLIRKGETNPAAIRRRAILHMNNTSSWNSL